MSLADELLADLEDVDADEQGNWDDGQDSDNEIGDGFAEPQADDFNVAIEEGVTSIRQIAKLSETKKFQGVLRKIDEFDEQTRQRTEILGSVENDPEYSLIVEANNMIVEIDNEISVIHKFVRDIYQKRFPELENLVFNPIDFIRTVAALQNEMDVSKIDLSQILAPATIMVVSVTSSTTKGQALDDDELSRVLEACNMGILLWNSKTKIFHYVESRMAVFAPNLTIICGSSTAAKLMGTAGGLTALSRMPSCNILLLGSQKRSMQGFSSTTTLPHTGFIYYCDLVQSQVPEIRRKAARVVACKCALAARIDCLHDKNTKNATIGLQFRDYIIQSINQSIEPPPAKLEKALPRPDEIHGKKRAGKRVKRMRDRTSLTKIRSNFQRVSFGRIEEDILQDEIGFSTGRVGEESGHVRVTQSTQRKQTLSKKLQKELDKTPIHGGMSTIRGGTSSSMGTASVVFTPFQGLEIHNPQAAEKKVAEANAKYFGKSGFDFANKRPKV